LAVGVEGVEVDGEEAGAEDGHGQVDVVPLGAGGVDRDDVVAEGVVDEGVRARVGAPAAAFDDGAGAGRQGVALAAELVGAINDLVAVGFEPAAGVGNFGVALGWEIGENGAVAADEGVIGGEGQVGEGGVGFDEVEGAASGLVGGDEGVVFAMEEVMVGLDMGVHVGVDLVSDPEEIRTAHEEMAVVHRGYVSTHGRIGLH
jgi:hypothetical protein